MSGQRERKVGSVDSAAVVTYPDQLEATATNLNCNGRGPGVDCVLRQLLHHGHRALHDLTGGDERNDAGVQLLDRGHGYTSLRTSPLRPLPILPRRCTPNLNGEVACADHFPSRRNAGGEVRWGSVGGVADRSPGRGCYVGRPETRSTSSASAIASRTSAPSSDSQRSAKAGSRAPGKFTRTLMALARIAAHAAHAATAASDVTVGLPI